MEFNLNPWWRIDTYDDDSACGPMDLDRIDIWGKNGPAMIQLWPNGSTAEGWGRETFMTEYNKGMFQPRRILYGYNKQKWNYAWIMRGTRVVCVDIDGKNGGFEHASELGFLPHTAAEISKSGNGYHLFYLTDDIWDTTDGFATYRDHIGIVQGVDIRGTGCVYHHPGQRWNRRPLAQLPQFLDERLQQRARQQQLQTSNINKILALDPEEVAIMHDELISDLAKPIPAGKRNNTLFAIGQKMKQAQVPRWDELLQDRAIQLGLDIDEAEKLVANVARYQ